MSQRTTTILRLLLACGLACYASVAPAQETSEPIPIKQGAPEGFEQLAGPQETSVDVIFGGEKIGSFRAVYTPKSIVFASPEEIVSTIPALKHEAAEHVRQALTGELPTQTEAACGRVVTKDCGLLKPEVAGVIFYENNFRADLFVNPSMLEVQDTHMDRILPPAPTIFSAVHQLNGNITGTNSSQEFSVLDNSIFAYGPQRLQFIGIASNEQKQVNTFAASMDRWGMESTAGLFNTHALQLLPQMSITGVSLQTSLKTNLALRDSAGSSLEVFLPQRSYVSLVYNGIIYSTEMYDAGNQILNTSALPEGAYDVIIRVRTLDGVESEEHRFFAKNFAIPPLDQPIYFGQIGSLRDPGESNAFSSISNEAIATGGMIRRISESIALDLDFLALKSKVFTEIGSFLLLPPNHQFQISTLASSDSDYGIGGSYLGYYFNKIVSLSANAREIISGGHAGTASPSFDFADPITGDSKQFTSSLSYQFNDQLSIGFDAHYSDSESSPRAQYAYGPKLRYNIWRRGANNLILSSSFNQTERGPQGTIFLNLTMRLGDWGLSGQSSLISKPESTSFSSGYEKSLNTRVTWNDDKNPDHTTVIGAEAQHNDESNGFLADLDHRAPYGNIKLLGSQTDTPSGQQQFYSGNLNFSVAHTLHDFAWGGRHQDSSGFIFKNEGNSTDVPMKVLVNNTERATFETGKSTPLFLSPYNTYKVSIRPVNSAAIDYDGNVKSITLYPGNIMPLVWDINQVKVVVGHVIMPDGTPLANARLEEARNITVTDDAGLFQGELLQLKTLTFRRSEEEQSIFKNQPINDFTLPPMPRSYPFAHTNMTLEEQRKVILDVFDSQQEEAPVVPPKDQLEPLITPLQNLQKTLSTLLGIKLPESDPLPAKEKPPTATAIAAPVTPVETTVVTPGEESASPESPAAAAPAPQSTAETLPERVTLPAMHCRVTLPEVTESNGVYIYPEPLVCTPLPDEKLTAEEKMKKANIQRVRRLMASNFDYGNMRGMFNAFSRRPTAGHPMKPRTLMASTFKPVIATSKPVAVTPEQPLVPVSETPPAEKIIPVAAVAPAETLAQHAVGVQLGSYRSESSALAARRKFEASSTLLRNRMYNIIRADLGRKGIYYRLRIEHFLNKREANDFCKELATRGHSCITSSN